MHQARLHHHRRVWHEGGEALYLRCVHKGIVFATSARGGLGSPRQQRPKIGADRIMREPAQRFGGRAVEIFAERRVSCVGTFGPSNPAEQRITQPRATQTGNTTSP